MKLQLNHSSALRKIKPLKFVGAFFSALVPHANKCRWQVIKYKRESYQKKLLNKRLMSDLLPQINSISMATVTSVGQNIQDFSKEKLKYLKCHFSWKHRILSLNRFPKCVHSTLTGRRAFWLSRASSANASEYISSWQTGPTAVQM